MKNLPEIKSELATSSDLDEKVVAGIAKANRPDDEDDVIMKNTKSSGRCGCTCCKRKAESESKETDDDV